MAGSFKGTVNLADRSVESTCDPWGPKADPGGCIHEHSIDGFLASISESGNVRWTIDFGGAGEDAAYGVVSDGEGGCIVTGGFSSNTIDACFTKGNIQCSGGPVKFGSWSLAHDGAGTSIFVMRVDGSGVIMWALAGANALKAWYSGMNGLKYANNAGLAITAAGSLSGSYFVTGTV